MTRSITAAIGLLVLLGGCAADSAADGPSAVADGTYTLLATSLSQAPDAATSLTITGDQVEVTADGETMSATLGEPGGTGFALCPPGGMGSPQPLGVSVEVGGVSLDQPALFGDCGQTKPVRVTLVDLASTTDQAFPFATWAEFCDSTDPDC